MKYPQIKIHLGASVNTVTVDGRKFDRYHMEAGQRLKLNRLVAQGWAHVYENEQRSQRKAGKRR